MTAFPFAGPQLAALIVAISFAAGLNVYATVATLGLLAHYSLLELPPGLHLLNNWWVIGAALALFAIEFFADKSPSLRPLLERPPHLRAHPRSSLDGLRRNLAAFAGDAIARHAGRRSLIALAAHGGKTAARVAVTPSPEPFSNFALSAGEDTLAVFVTWLATHHPIAAAAIAAVFLIVIVVMVRWIVRTIVRAFRSPQPSTS